MQGIEKILKLVCKNFNDNNIDYVIVGGFAVIFYGNPRTTMDLGAVMQIPRNADIKQIVGFFKENEFFASAEDMSFAFAEKSRCTVEHKKTMFRIDIKGVYNEMDKRTIQNKKAVDFQGTKIHTASPEDTIINKLIFAREHDLKDALGIYARQSGKLDEEYLLKMQKNMAFMMNS